jgi:hypothetical protein
MPMNRKLYPRDWEEISQRIRTERAGNRCEWCDIPNRLTIIRSRRDSSQYIVYDPETSGYQDMDGNAIRLSEIPEEFDGPHIKVVLTVAHLDHNPANNHPGNLAALCQRCHNQYDRPKRAHNAHRTRIAKKREARARMGQLEMDL